MACRDEQRFDLCNLVAQTADKGHGFDYLDVSTWEPDVFAFLDEHKQK